MRIAMILLAAAACAAPLAADMGPKPRTTAPGLQFHAGDVKDINVEMTAEEVHLVLRKGEQGDRLDVTATFHMTNLGDATSFEVGFPIGPYKNMTGFKAVTDGTEHQLKLIDRRPAKEGINEEEAGMHVHDYWYVWDASYAAKAKATHVITYSVDTWHYSEHRSTGYILHSGAGWKNAIGKAVVTLKFDGKLTADHLRSIGPVANLEFKDDSFSWTFENLEPTAADNISISYNTRITYKDEVALLRSEREKYWDSRTELVGLLGRGHRRQGRTERTAAELDECVAALADLLSELKEEDDKLIMPGKTTEKVRMPDDMDEDMRKMLEAIASNRPRSYCYGHSMGAFFDFIGVAAGIVEAHPEHTAAREALVKWHKVGQAFIDGKLYADDAKIEAKNKGDQRDAVKRVTQHMEKAAKLLAPAKD
ncbi:MAG: hypothetical protein IPK87_06180 [Planctomycetes bacterium]|nr:hypothetical protein [Planctomycetota bacterium]